MRRMKFVDFRRRFMIFRIGQLNSSRVFKLSGGAMTIPYLSILHLTNTLNIEGEIVPSLDEIGMFTNRIESKIRLTYNDFVNKQYPTYELKDKTIREIPAGIKSSQAKFKSTNAGVIEVYPTLEQAHTTSLDKYTVCSHAAMRQVRITGIQKEVRFYEHFYSVMFDCILNAPVETEHFLPIQAINLYQRTDFNAILMRGKTISTMQMPSDPVYILLANLLLYARQTEHDNIFKQYTKEQFERLNFIFYTPTTFICINAFDLIGFLGADFTTTDKVFKLLETLFTAGTDTETATDDDGDDTDRTDSKEISDVDDTEIEPLYEIETKEVIQPPVAPTKAKLLDPPVIKTKALKRSEILDQRKKPAPQTTVQVIEDLSSETVDSEVVSLATEKQQNTLKALANQYKDIEIDGKKLIDILASGSAVDPVQPITLDHLKDEVLDDSFLQSSIYNFDDTYRDTQLERSILANAVSLRSSGRYLVDVKKTVVKNTMDDYVIYKFYYKDKNFKSRKPIEVKIPTIREDGYILTRGSLKKIGKQRLNIPICKVSPTRVALNSDYIKAQVEWLPKPNRSFEHVIDKLLKKHPGKIKYTHGHYLDRKRIYPTELSKLATRFKDIRWKGKFFWSFDLEQVTYVDDLWRLTPEESPQQHYLDINNTLHIYHNGAWVKSTTIIDYLMEHLGETKPPVIVDYTVVSILSKSIPTGLVLAYRYGLEGMLTRLNLPYDFSATKKDLDIDGSKIVIRLADGYLSFSRYPYTKSLIAAGLTVPDLSRYSFDDLSSKEVYYNVFESSGISPGFLRGIDSFFNLFIDPTTYEILVSMKEPTTVGGLLVRATEMLATTEHEQASSVTNFRFRSYGKIPAIFYNELSKAAATAQSNTLKGSEITINPEAVYQRILQDALTTNVDINNPIGAIREKAVYTYAGPGGRTEDSFTNRDRLYPQDGKGVISEASVDSPSVSFRAYYTGDPSIINMAGMECPVDSSESLGSHNLLSVVGSLVPGVMQDDPKRGLLTGAQMSQAIAVNGYEPARVRTTYEKVVPYLCGEPFTYVAKYDGKVVAHDSKLQQIKIEYSNGERRIIQYGDTIARYSAMGIHVTQSIQPHSLLGKTFKRNDIIAYNKDFFQEELDAPRVIWKSGVNLIVALQDKEGTLEDSSLISQKAIGKFNFYPVHEEKVILEVGNHIVSFADIGTEVTPISPLLTFEPAETIFDTDTVDEETVELINKLNRKVPKAGSNGTVADIEVFYKAPLSEMSKSMRKFINHVEAGRKARAEFGKDTINGTPAPHPLTYADKVGYVDLESDTVIAKFYIRSKDVHCPGSKQSIHSALKTVTAKIAQHPVYTEDRKLEIDLMYAQLGYMKRMVWSPVLSGMGSLLMRTLNERIVND